MRKLLCCLLCLCMALSLCSCAPAEPTELQKEETVTALSDELIRCLSTHDREGFADLFCAQVRAHPDFESQVDALFDFFEADNYTRSQYVQFVWDTRHFSASVVYIQDPMPLADGTPWHWFFELRFDCVITDRDDSLTGIHTLTVIRSNDGRQFQIGTDDFWP